MIPPPPAMAVPWTKQRRKEAVGPCSPPDRHGDQPGPSASAAVPAAISTKPLTRQRAGVPAIATATPWTNRQRPEAMQSPCGT